MPTISATFTPTPQLVVQSYRAINRERIIVRWASSAVVAVLGIALQLWPLIVLAIIFPLISELIIRRQLRPLQAEQRKVTLTMTDQDFKVQGPDHAIAYPWTALTGVRRRGDFWVLKHSLAPATSFPAAALTPKQTAAFTDLIRSKGLLAG